MEEILGTEINIKY